MSRASKGKKSTLALARRPAECNITWIIRFSRSGLEERRAMTKKTAQIGARKGLKPARGLRMRIIQVMSTS
ncbi:hypothetical protein D3C86_1923550 [compost metagenome]